MKKLKRLILISLLFALNFAVFANADTGPKPSVRINFENLGDELCYGTLLSETDSYGPSSAWDGTEEDARYNDNQYYDWSELDYETWKAFVEYEDTDGFYFLQEGWRVDETKELAWTYYPPAKFKILLYFPESDSFAVSGIYERYAFDSYFTVDMSGIEINAVDYNEELSNNNNLYAEKSYDYFDEIMSLIGRIVITIAIEVGIALLFGFGSKKTLIFITAVNAVTQIILNVLLNLINYKSGQMAYVAFYVMAELAIIVFEAVSYSIFLRILGEDKKVLPVVYAVVANAVSFGAGMFISVAFPGIF